MNNKVVLISGATSGIGEQSAYALKALGYTVYGGARNTKKLEELQHKGIKTIYLDVTNDASMQMCVHHIIHNEGRIDVLINNAGYGLFGSIEDTSMQKAKEQMEVNVFGLARLTQLVLPHMRKQKDGKIINIASIGGRVWTPYGGWYHASKFAVEGLSACLRLETKPFNIDVILIEPGAIATNWAHIAASHLEDSTKDSAYAKQAKRVATAMRDMYNSRQLTHPKTIAKCVAKAVQAHNPKIRYVRGYRAKSAILLHKMLGDNAYDQVLKLIYKL